MPLFKEENFLIIHPGSRNTLFSIGLKDSLAPPSYKIPTIVYKKDNTYQSSGDESNKVWPIQRGEIVDLDAFNFLIKLILSSLIRENPTIITSQIPLLIISSKNWSKSSIEYVTKYVMENLDIAAFNILPSALAANFAYGSFNNCCVVDVGYEKTEITSIIDYQPINYATLIPKVGSKSINDNLANILPSLTASQIESLKKSDIYEILSEQDIKKSFYGIEGLNDDDDEGILDVAKIVTSENTKEFLEKNEKLKNKSKNNEDQLNSELENNFFIDDDGKEIYIGKERFKGSEPLLDEITKNIYKSLSMVDDLNKRQECFDNIIIIGQTSKIKGFKEYLLNNLFINYLIAPPKQSLSFQSHQSTQLNLIQIPLSIRFIKSPEYFPEWKKIGFEDCVFLGGEIVSKQIYGSNHNNDGFLNRDDYHERGPMAIWDVTF